MRQYERLFEMDGVELKFEQEVLEYIVDKAVEFKLGARGLRSIAEAIMTDAMFELPSSDLTRFTVTLDYARERFERANLAQLKQVG